MNRYSLYCLCVFLMFWLWGCGSSVDVEMLEGTFTAPVNEPFKGAGKKVPEKTLLFGASASFNYAKDREIQMDVSNKGKTFSGSRHYDYENGAYVEGVDLVMPSSDVDFFYKFERMHFSATFDWMYKHEKALVDLSIILNPYPFFRFAYGTNRSFWEAGVYGGFGGRKEKGTYLYNRYFASHTDMGFTQQPSVDSNQVGQDRQTRIYADLGAYGSIYFWNRLALTASFLSYEPWGAVADLNGGNLTFRFPWLYSLYGGASVWLGDHVKASAGPMVFCGGKDPVLVLNASLGFWM